jgi:probable HAF family extracellular repeat protein
MNTLKTILCTILVLLFVLAGSASVAFAQASFQGLGPLDAYPDSCVGNVSPDGLVSVGAGGIAYWNYAARWTALGGWQLLGQLGANPYSSAFAASGDGSVIVGWAGSFPNNYQGYPWKWTATSGMQPLASAPDRPNGNALDISADGSTVVGCSTGAWRAQACRWLNNGNIELLGILPRNTDSFAMAVSADGSVVAGLSKNIITGQPENWGEAFRWTAATGMVGLGSLPGKTLSQANECTPDGSVIVGACYATAGSPSPGWETFRWTQETGMVGLGVVPGDTDSIANAISADGSIVIGADYEGLDGTKVYATIWDATHGMRRLQDVLENDYHLDLTGWTLQNAEGISDDGRTIVGYGINPSQHLEGWIFTIPEPATIVLLVTGGLLMLLRWRKRSQTA